MKKLILKLIPLISLLFCLNSDGVYCGVPKGYYAPPPENTETQTEKPGWIVSFFFLNKPLSLRQKKSVNKIKCN